MYRIDINIICLVNIEHRRNFFTSNLFHLDLEIYYASIVMPFLLYVGIYLLRFKSFVFSDKTIDRFR